MRVDEGGWMLRAGRRWLAVGWGGGEHIEASNRLLLDAGRELRWGKALGVRTRGLLAMTKNIPFPQYVLLNQSFVLPLDGDLLHSWVGLSSLGNLIPGLFKTGLGDKHGNKDTSPFAKSHFKMQRARAELMRAQGPEPPFTFFLFCILQT